MSIYKNTAEESINDTRLFLKEIIGSYMEITICENKVKCDFYNNEQKISNNQLYDNARCYTEYSVPFFARDSEILKLFEYICQNIKCRDKTLFFALGDFPIIMKDRKKHPHYDRCIGEYNVYPKYMERVFSRSIIKELHDDLLFPTRDYVNIVVNNNIPDTNMPDTNDFYNKKNIAVFRGTMTGNDRTINNTRIQAKILSLKYPNYLDVDITNPFNYYMYDQKYGPICSLIDDSQLIGKNFNQKCISMENQFKNFKYILHIDGFVSAWRMANELFSMSVILKVNSPWIEHYYCDLIPYYHYIPIKQDLSNLIQTIEWCKNNDDICYKIAQNAYNYAKNNITKNNTCNYLIKICELSDNYFECETKDENTEKTICQIKLGNIIPEEISINFENIKYKHYVLPVKKTKNTNNVNRFNTFSDVDIIFKNRKRQRCEFIEDKLYEKLIEYVEKVIYEFEKKNETKFGNCIIDSDLEELVSINKNIETRIKDIINIVKKTKIKEIIVDFVTIKNLNKINNIIKSLSHKDFALLFFTKNKNNFTINNIKSICTKNDIFVVNKNDNILFNCEDENDLLFCAFIEIKLCPFAIVESMMTLIEKNILQIEMENYDEVQIMQKMVNILHANNNNHLCINLNINTMDEDFFSNIKDTFDLISDVQIDGNLIECDNKYISLKKIAKYKCKNNVKFKVYFFQPQMRKLIYELMHFS